jgi:sporulation protein YlmC with PRC-barrel domain
MTIDTIRLRSEVLNTQVITRSTGKRLGVVREMLVDIDRREVVALGLRDNRFSLSGLPSYMYLSSIQQTGDVILVEDENVIEDVDIEVYSQLINCEVITETGEPLGRVRDFQFSLEDGRVTSLIISSLGIPQIPDQFISTYELSIDEVISSGPNRLIVFEGAEERITQLTVGLLERLGIGRPPWEKDEEETYYAPAAPPENQLPTGIPVRQAVSKPVEVKAPVIEENWNEDEWEEVRPAPQPQRQAQAMRYEEYEEEELEEDNWGESKVQAPKTRYQSGPRDEEYDYDEDVEGDVWDDNLGNQPYDAPRVNIPAKQKTPEYEEDMGY